jgi:hypothetical protein
MTLPSTSGQPPALTYFRRVRAGVDTAPFLAEIDRLDDAWSRVTGRQDKIQVQREALAIPLRGLRRSLLGTRKPRDAHESRWTSTSRLFPHACAFIEEIAGAEGSLLSRAKLVCLPAGRRVYPHIDRGEYYRLRNRYHLVLRSGLGSWLRSGGEEVRMQEGELWWFDNLQLHEAHNDGEQDRIHLIFDLLPEARAQEIAWGAGEIRDNGLAADANGDDAEIDEDALAEATAGARA